MIPPGGDGHRSMMGQLRPRVDSMWMGRSLFQVGKCSSSPAKFLRTTGSQAPLSSSRQSHFCPKAEVHFKGLHIKKSQRESQ